MKEKILTKLLKMNFRPSRFYAIAIIIGLTTQIAMGQNVITGKVISDLDNLGLPGVTIIVKGTAVGTSTDIDGKYSITASSTDVLVYSFVGFKTIEIATSGRSVIDISMEEDISALEEIIVTGYSQKSQKEISAAVVSLDVQDLTNVTSSSVENMLQGKVAGLTVNSPTGQPGAAPDIRLRGITSINADRSPLIVVDGMIGGNYVPSDVESITVLKDAAAIGLYGSRGAAGVLIITTKRAKSGQSEYQLSATVGIKEASTGKFEMMNAAEIYDTQKIMWGPDNLINFLSNRPEEIRDQDFDWIGAGFRQAMIQNYNFAARGSKERLSYTFNADYFDEEGTFVNTDFQRLNLRAGVRFDSEKVFSINSDVNVQFNDSEYDHYSWFEDSFYSFPWDDPYYDDGTTKFVNSTDFTGDWYGQFRRNFVNSIDYNNLNSTGLDVVWSTRLMFNITDWLSIETRTRLNGYSNRSDEFYSASTHEGIAANGILNTNTSGGRGILNTILVRLNKSFGDHDLSGFLAQEGSSSSFQTLNTEVQNMAPSISVPAGGSVYSLIDGYDQSSSGISFISEANYGFRSKYFATVVFRRDGSSVFAENKRFANFPSASAAWLISEESFLANSQTIDLFKLRLSYGLVGNDGQGTASGPQAYAYLATYNLGRQYNAQPGGDPDNPANDELGWETSKIANLGVDLGFLKGDFVVNIDAYQKKVEEMLFLNPLAFSQGYQARWENIGSMRNNGIELALNYTKSWDKWSYNGNFNISYNDNQVTYISEVTDTGFQTSGDVTQINRVGLEAFMWYMPRWIGVDPANGNPVWEKVEADGSLSETSVYTDATYQPIESALPKLTGGMTNSVSFQDITLSFLITWQTGGHIYHSTREFVDSDGANTGINMMRLADGWSRWSEPGDVATHTKLTRGDDDGSHFTSSRYLEKGDFLRLRNVSLSYNFPQSMLEKAKIKGLSITASADNLFTLTEFSGMDPDINMTLSPYNLPGMSFLKYPISKQYLLKLNLTF